MAYKGGDNGFKSSRTFNPSLNNNNVMQLAKRRATQNTKQPSIKPSLFSKSRKLFNRSRNYLTNKIKGLYKRSSSKNTNNAFQITHRKNNIYNATRQIESQPYNANRQIESQPYNATRQIKSQPYNANRQIESQPYNTTRQIESKPYNANRQIESQPYNTTRQNQLITKHVLSNKNVPKLTEPLSSSSSLSNSLNFYTDEKIKHEEAIIMADEDLAYSEEAKNVLKHTKQRNLMNASYAGELYTLNMIIKNARARKKYAETSLVKINKMIDGIKQKIAAKNNFVKGEYTNRN
jgi:hypothetical protein